MTYTNPPVDETVNLPKGNQLWEFGWMLVAVAILVTVLIVTVAFASQWLVRFVPFDYEVRLVEASGLLERFAAVDAEQETRHARVEGYLQNLAQRLQGAQDKAHQQITVHFVATDTVNAFATLGGHIVIHQGLLEQLSSEQGLAMVLAHEIAHIEHRDPITSLGRGLSLSLAFSVLIGASEQGSLGYLLEATGGSLLLNFSRRQERAADAAALQALVALYGHPVGATEFFDYVAINKGDERRQVPTFLQTHPGVDERLEVIRAAIEQAKAASSGAPETANSLIPLPSFLATPPAQASAVES